MSGSTVVGEGLTAMAVDMEPALWGTLPEELLELVFSRLSVAEVCGVRLLSKDWKRKLDTPGSEFSRVLETTVYRRMFGFVVWRDADYDERMRGRVLDVKAQRWHLGLDFTEEQDQPNSVIIVVVADGGLVCFVSESFSNNIRFRVMNPLTKKKVTLPCLCQIDGGKPSWYTMMVQLTVDRETQQYKLFAAGFLRDLRAHAQVYDSKTKGWSIVGLGCREKSCPDRIFGSEYCPIERSLELRVPCVYDFAGGLQYFCCETIIPSEDGALGPYAVLNNRLFVLRGDRSPGRPIGFYISEYVLEKDATAFAKVQDIRKLPIEGTFNDPLREDSEDSDSDCYIFTVHDFTLHACNGFLTVFGRFFPVGFSYDLSTCQWEILPRIWGDREGDSESEDEESREHSPMDLMCEFRWDATP